MHVTNRICYALGSGRSGGVSLSLLQQSSFEQAGLVISNKTLCHNSILCGCGERERWTQHRDEEDDIYRHDTTEGKTGGGVCLPWPLPRPLPGLEDALQPLLWQQISHKTFRGTTPTAPRTVPRDEHKRRAPVRRALP